MMILKKKTIIIVTLVLLLVAAGYVSTKYGKIIKVNNDKDTTSQTEVVDKTDTASTNSQAAAAGYFIDVKLGRENQRTVDKQTLNEMINNKNISKEAKQKAENQLLNIVNFSEKEMIVEALIKAKGFEDALVFIDDSSANVTVKVKELKADQVNLIKNIVCKESALNATKVMIQARE
jgi:stage III sporulation protein AH